VSRSSAYWAVADALVDGHAVDRLVDSFEQRVQRPSAPGAQRGYYSGKKKTHTLKSQVVVQPGTGLFLDVAESVPGPTNDRTLLRQSGVRERLPRDALLGGDLGYYGESQGAVDVAVETPRRKPRGQPRPAEDIAYNTAFARRRVTVEHSIGRMRCYESLSQRDRHHRRGITARNRAVAGLVNRRMAG